MIRDPLDDFFGVDSNVTVRRETAPIEESSEEPIGPIENSAIASDVALVREKLRTAIVEAADALPEFLALAQHMQEPDMIDSASKMLTALGKLSTDLINIDVRVLAESKKVKDRQPVVAPVAQGEFEAVPGQKVVSEATTVEVLRALQLAADEMDREAENADS